MGKLLYIVEKLENGTWIQTAWTNDSGATNSKRPKRVSEAKALAALHKAKLLYPMCEYRISKPFEVTRGKK